MSGISAASSFAANNANFNRSMQQDTPRFNHMPVERERQQPVPVAKSDQEARADLEQKIRNREIPCPACSSRKYKDESDDAGASFKAAQSIPSSTAGISVLRHEQEHVMFNDTKPGETEGGFIRDSTVTLKYDTCSECGRRYVAGGLTKTSAIPAPDSQKKEKDFALGELDFYI